MGELNEEGKDNEVSKRSWKLIALAVIAGLAVVLLCTTIVLAATGVFKSENRLSGTGVVRGQGACQNGAGQGACSGECGSSKGSCDGSCDGAGGGNGKCASGNCESGTCDGSAAAGSCTGDCATCPSKGACTGSQSGACPSGTCEPQSQQQQVPSCCQ